IFDQVRRAVEFAVAALFLFPLAILVLHIGSMNAPPLMDVAPYLRSTLIQAILSGIGAVTIGSALAVGLLHLESSRTRQIFQLFFLIPGVVPALYVVLSLLQIFGFFRVHPM